MVYVYLAARVSFEVVYSSMYVRECRMYVSACLFLKLFEWFFYLETWTLE